MNIIVEYTVKIYKNIYIPRSYREHQHHTPQPQRMAKSFWSAKLSICAIRLVPQPQAGSASPALLESVCRVGPVSRPARELTAHGQRISALDGIFAEHR